MVASDGQYLCEENGEIIAAFGLNDKPQGKYSKAKWGNVTYFFNKWTK